MVVEGFSLQPQALVPFIQAMKEAWDQDSTFKTSHVVWPMRISAVMLMKFSDLIQLGKERTSSIVCTGFSVGFFSRLLLCFYVCLVFAELTVVCTLL